jgi:hypothetical protein
MCDSQLVEIHGDLLCVAKRKLGVKLQAIGRLRESPRATRPSVYFFEEDRGV